MARAADELVSVLRSEIHSGALKPGDQLEEAALAKRFGVSRMPVRQAVRSLVESGLLETRARKGAFVRVLSPKELADLFEVAAELEGLACRLAASVLTEDDVEAISRGLEDCVHAASNQDSNRYAIANLRFHGAIHKASGNDWLADQLAQIEVRINSYRSMPYQIRGRLAQSVQEHREIMDVLVKGNGHDAARLMRDHMLLQGKRIPLLVSSSG
ncbi:MAG: GntR family transcriptional regulator [Pseudomonadota bacterium]